MSQPSHDFVITRFIDVRKQVIVFFCNCAQSFRSTFDGWYLIFQFSELQQPCTYDKFVGAAFPNLSKTHNLWEKGSVFRVRVMKGALKEFCLSRPDEAQWWTDGNAGVT